MSCDIISNYEAMLLVGDDKNGSFIYNLITGKLILKKAQKTVGCKFSRDAKQIISGTQNGIILISDCIRGHTIKSLQHHHNKDKKSIYSCSFDYAQKLTISTTEDSLCIQDVAYTKCFNLISFKSKIQSDNQNYSLNPDGNQTAILEDNNTISFNNVYLRNLSEHNIPVRGANSKGFSIKDTIVNSSFGLSEKNLQIFKQIGSYNQFDEKMIRKLFTKNSKDAETVEEVTLSDKQPIPIDVKIIASDLTWVNLKKLDLSRTRISDEGAVSIANNNTWKSLKSLDLSFNLIKNQGAKAIGMNKTWVNTLQ